MKKLLLKLGSGRSNGNAEGRNIDENNKKTDPAKYLLPELLVSILMNLNVKDLLSANGVSKAWQSIAKKDIVWRSVILNDHTDSSYKDFMSKFASDGVNIRGKLICRGIQKEIGEKEKSVEIIRASFESAQKRGGNNVVIESYPVGALANPASCVVPIFDAVCSFFIAVSKSNKINKEKDKIEVLKNEANHYNSDTSTASYR